MCMSTKRTNRRYFNYISKEEYIVKDVKSSYSKVKVFMHTTEENFITLKIQKVT